jgi:hypothetical protein
MNGNTRSTNEKSASLIDGAVFWDDDRKPLKDVMIRIFDEASETGKPAAETSTDEHGRFSFKSEDSGFAGPELSKVFKSDSIKRIVIADADGGILKSYNIDPRKLKNTLPVLGLSVPAIKKDLVGKIKPHLRPVVRLGSFYLDRAVWEDLKLEDLFNLSRINVGQLVHSSARRKLERLCSNLLPDEMGRRSLCSTEAVLAMYEIERQKGWTGYTENDVDLILTSFIESGFAEEIYESANFITTYQTDGVQGVNPDKSAMDIIDPGSDPAVVLDTIPAGGASDPPTYIRLIAFWLERALSSYVNAPYSLLNPAASGKIPVYVNHSSAGSASPSGFFSIHWDLSPELVCAVSVHELFHMVQFEYGLVYGDPWRQSIMEGGAVLSEDSAADAMNRYLYEASTTWNGDGVLVSTNKSLISASYDSALFWRYICEQHSSDIVEPYVGVETYRKIIETCSSDGCTTAAVEKAIRQLPWYEEFYKFGYFDPTRQEISRSETTMANYVLAMYLKDLGTNIPDPRFEFLEDEENIGFDEVLETQWPGAGTATNQLGSPTFAGDDTLIAGTSLAYSETVNPFGTRYYKINIDAGVDNVEVDFNAGASLTSLIFQIVQIDTVGGVRDIHRTDKTAYTKRIANQRDGKHLERVIIAVTGCETGGSFTLDVTSVGAASDVMVTRWNSAMKKEYEIRSRYWHWISPDIWVDNDGNGLADSEVYFDYNNKLTIRLHNKGNALANDIQVEFWYQDATGGLRHTDWLPVRNKSGVVQNLVGLTLAAETSDTWSVDWSPTPSGTSKHFCVRAIVTSPTDINTDNKMVTSNFGNVIAKPPYTINLPLLRRHLRLLPSLVQLKAIVRTPRKTDSDITIEPVLPTNRNLILKSGEQITDHVKLVVKPGIKRVKALPTAKKSSAKTIDDSNIYPPEESLPPGVWGKPLVTILHEVEGEAIGGFTAAVIVDDRP